VLDIILVVTGGMIGSVLRYWWSSWIANRFGEIFPYGTLFVNVLASILIGFVLGYLLRITDPLIARSLREFVAIGICGGLSTFSSFSLQTFNLLLSRKWFSTLFNIVGSTLLCLGAAALGWWGGRSL
jgi:fluoride exporter